ncbi:MAG: hypothetical protein HKN70_10185 [Gammaproteobacteria bacterium]|nr:hypothetical protein [Gammaproteobacteria bacterium]
MISATLVAMAWTQSAFPAQETLQNDGFASGATVTFQGGFVAGEMAAARFVPQIGCPCIIETISLLFGGAVETRDVGINIWDDSAGSTVPGPLLFTGTVSLTGSNVNLQEIDFSLSPVLVDGPFRVGLEFTHSGLPSVATDLDGTIDATANFILADIGVLFWFQSQTLGVSGDFVIRATIDNLVSPDTDEDGITDDMDNCTEVANADQRDSNGDGHGNACDFDYTNNCVVNFLDLAPFSDAFGATTGDANFNDDVDLDGDGVINFLDFGAPPNNFAAAFTNPPGPSANACTPAP